jgi:hypothetical protein
VDRVEDAVSGELGCEVVEEVLVREEKKKKKRSRKSMVASEFERCFSVRVDSAGSGSGSGGLSCSRRVLSASGDRCSRLCP